MADKKREKPCFDQIEEEGVITLMFNKPTINETGDSEEMEAFTKTLKEKDSPRVMVDFYVVTYLDSNMLGKLITLNKMVVARNGRLALWAMKSDVRKQFDAKRLGKVLMIKDTRDEAFAYVSGA